MSKLVITEDSYHGDLARILIMVTCCPYRCPKMAETCAESSDESLYVVNVQVSNRLYPPKTEAPTSKLQSH